MGCLFCCQAQLYPSHTWLLGEGPFCSTNPTALAAEGSSQLDNHCPQITLPPWNGQEMVTMDMSLTSV